MIKTLLYVGLGGAFGSILRYLTSVWVARLWQHKFPLATLLVNILGCFLMGLLVGYLEKNQLTDGPSKWLWITGFCGGYTTFSTFGMENYNLIQNQNIPLALLYISFSLFIGLLAIWLGLFMTK